MTATALTPASELIREIANAETIDGVKDLRDKAEAIRSYLKSAGYHLKQQNEAALAKILAERRGGEILAGLARGKPGPQLADSVSANSEYLTTIKKAKMGERMARRWQLVWEVPNETFWQHADEKIDAERELTSGSVIALARKLRRETERENNHKSKCKPGLYQIQESTVIIGDAHEMDLSQFPHKYGVIIADPPWPYRVSRMRGVAEEYYKSMTDEEIAAMPVSDLTADDCVLLLWATWPKLPSALNVMKAWEFDYVTGFPWIKTTMASNNKASAGDVTLSYGVGFWLRGATEIILLGRRGTPRKPDMNYAGVLSPNLKHSRKPDSVHDIAESMDSPYLELFARRSRPGWTVFGNEIQELLL